jgi:hypothetical protein
MNLLELPNEILKQISELTYVYYYEIENDNNNYSDPFLVWYHNRICKFKFNQFKVSCKLLSSI